MSEIINNKQVDDLTAVDIPTINKENSDNIEDISDIIEEAAIKKITSKERRSYEKATKEREINKESENFINENNNTNIIDIFLITIILSIASYFFYLIYKKKKEETKINE